MVYRLERFFRHIRRYFSRNEWLLRFLGLSKSKGTSHEKGLIIIQIDGLSHAQLKGGLDTGNMPFLKRLLLKEHYHIHSLYSGVPSSTPAVQGELFYGVKNCVPAFSFRRHQDNDVVMMIEPAVAESIEQKLAQQGEPLLKGGSAYANIFSGGAEEPHFCSASMGWGHLFRRGNPLAMVVFFLLNLYSFLRTFALMLLELLLALIDFFHGIIRRHNLIKELTFIPTRVAICVLLRELVTIGIKLDATRGLPIIHGNFLGYDEQSHRRGPESAFAHWSLKGIDNAIKRIWYTAERSAYRDYDLWIYSDHGQEHSLPYPQKFSANAEDIIVDIFKNLLTMDSTLKPKHNKFNVKTYFSGEQSQRVRLLGNKKVQKLFRHEGNLSLDKRMPDDKPDIFSESSKNAKPTTVAMGPLGFIYSPCKLSLPLRHAIAKALVKVAHIPLVITAHDFPDQDKQVRVYLSDGEYYLPLDKEKILGAKHSFLNEASNDLISVFKHPDVGDFVISGWRPYSQPYSFRIENGAHGGPGYEETHAFALLPNDTCLPSISKNYLRPLDLRKAALHLLGRTTLAKTSKKTHDLSSRQSLRIMTYNVHSCVGMDGKLSPHRIARVIAQYQPDIVALQELDVGRERTNSVDQAHLIATLLKMNLHFHPVIHVEEEHYGDAILTHLPMKLIKAKNLPMPIKARSSLEPRGILWVQIEYKGRVINMMNTHLGLTVGERRLQVTEILSDQWVGHPDCNEPIILCGDFNAAPWQSTCRRLSAVLQDAQTQVVDRKAQGAIQKRNYQSSYKPKNTFSGRYPLLRIDHIFVDKDIKVRDAITPITARSKIASDHLPLIVDLEIS